MTKVNISEIPSDLVVHYFTGASHTFHVRSWDLSSNVDVIDVHLDLDRYRSQEKDRGVPHYATTEDVVRLMIPRSNVKFFYIMRPGWHEAYRRQGDTDE